MKRCKLLIFDGERSSCDQPPSPVAARLAGGDDLPDATAGKPYCYGVSIHDQVVRQCNTRGILALSQRAL